jgi:hypothetical protein
MLFFMVSFLSLVISGMLPDGQEGSDIPPEFSCLVQYLSSPTVSDVYENYSPTVSENYTTVQ